MWRILPINQNPRVIGGTRRLVVNNIASRYRIYTYTVGRGGTPWAVPGTEPAPAPVEMEAKRPCCEIRNNLLRSSYEV